MAKVLGFLMLASALVGCGTFVKSTASEAAYDYSDWSSYDKPFGTSPEYAASAYAPPAAEPAKEAAPPSAASR